MKKRFWRGLAVLPWVLVGLSAPAQLVRSGSDGSLGALVATNRGEVLIPLPADGKLHYTSVWIGDGVTVRFSRNPLNTPVYLLASSNVLIEGIIDVSGTAGGADRVGSGGPGGFDGGTPGVGGPAGDGEGPGGGKGGFFNGDVNQVPGAGTFGTFGYGPTGSLYGNRNLDPLIGGSGGGGMADDPTTPAGQRGGGGGGGGAILIASDVAISLTGRIYAHGGNGTWVGSTVNRYSGGGSAGGVRLVSPAVTGSGIIDAGNAYSGGQTYGSGLGRIRIDAASTTSLNLYGITRIGGNFEVFPSVLPSLRITEVAGQSIPASAGSTIQIALSRSASTNQTVKLRARDFAGYVPITVAVIPEQGRSARFLGEINMAGAAEGETTISVVLTPGVVNRIQAWTQ